METPTLFQSQNPIIQRIVKAKGGLSQKWVAPTNYRKWAAGAKKVFKCYYVFKTHNILWPDLLTSFSEVSKDWLTIGNALFHKPMQKNNDLYFDMLEESSHWDVSEYSRDAVSIEETREHVDGHRCNMCKSNLVWPAYVVHRKAESTEVIDKSSPIGIRCLHAYKGKLQKLLTDNDFQKLKAMIKESEEPKSEAAEALASL